MASPGPRVVWMPGGVRTEIHLGAAESGGALCLVVDHPPEGWSIEPHRHHRESETIHILDGHFELVIDGEAQMVSPGDSVFIPAGTVHSARLLGGAGRRLLVFNPGGMEAFFLEAGTRHATSSGDVSRARHAASAHGWEFVGPGG